MQSQILSLKPELVEWVGRFLDGLSNHPINLQTPRHPRRVRVNPQRLFVLVWLWFTRAVEQLPGRFNGSSSARHAAGQRSQRFACAFAWVLGSSGAAGPGADLARVHGRQHSSGRGLLHAVLPILESGPGAAGQHDPFFFYNSFELQAVRSGPWKLHLPHLYSAVITGGTDGNAGTQEVRELPLSLFDLDADPGETANLAAQYPDVVRELTEAATAFDADLATTRRQPGQL
jgi:hypothetical protein